MKKDFEIIKKVITPILMSLILGNSSFAQIMTLDSILNAVETNNPKFKIYDARINAANEYTKGARSLPAPQVGAGLFMAPYNISLWNGDEAMGSNGMGAFMVTGQQMFTNKKKLDANYEFMNSMSAVDSSMKNVMRNEIFARVKMNYYDWVIMKKKIVILDESEELIKYLIESTELKYIYGMDKLTAYYKAKAMLGEIQTMKVMVENEMEQKMVALNTMMNRDPAMKFDIDTLFAIQNYEQINIDSSMIAESRSEYDFFNNKIDLLKAEQDKERAKKYPDFGIRYDHMFPFGTRPQQFSLMFMMTIPMVRWSSKMYTAKTEGLKYKILEVNEEKENFINQTSGIIQNLKVQMESKKEQIDLTQKVIVPSMQKNYEAELLAYEQNTEMLFMVLDAWQNLKVSKLLYYDQLMELLALQVLYEKEREVKK